MKQEKAFSAGGFYMFVLESNLMLHKNVTRAGSEFLQNSWIQSKSTTSPFKVLDLACGGAPVSIADILKAFPDYRFHYTGIDINIDQVIAARKFTYPDNVTSVQVIEGNAWDLSNLDDNYDIVFSGMNLHHGTPEEIYCLLAQVKALLTTGGIFLNHDFYRPSNFDYLRRPSHNPQNSDESFEMVPSTVRDSYCIPSYAFAESARDWRVEFIESYRKALQGRGAVQQGIDQIVEHVMARDFPISVPEIQTIADTSGLNLRQVELQSTDEPLGQYFCLVAASAA